MVKDVKLKKGMCRDEVNKLLKENDVDLELVDEIYGGVDYKYNWRCECGEVFIRTWYKIKSRKSIRCLKCVKNIKDEYKNISEVRISKGMSKDRVNKFIDKWLLLADDIYLGNKYKHNWRCKECGKTFEAKWSDIQGKWKNLKCKSCKYNMKDFYNSIHEVVLIKNMSKDEVNRLIGKWVLLEDSFYKNNSYSHKWKCIECGKVFKRTWSSIKSGNRTKCENCRLNLKSFYNNVSDVNLVKNMTKDEVNKLIEKWILLEDNTYKNNSHLHNWKCLECGEVFKRRWNDIKKNNRIECKNHKNENKYKYEVEKTEEYEYIRRFRTGEVLPNGKIAKAPYIQIKHKFCESIYEVSANSFINMKQRCPKCCGSYENSFAYYIEKELEESLEKYWDFEKNIANPYHISKNKSNKNSKGEDTRVWIKCQNKDYHGSYITSTHSFVRGSRCPYCASKKIHVKDSFVQYHIENTDKNFIKKYWDFDKNTIDFFCLSKNTIERVWIKCQNKDYHGSYSVDCDSFTRGSRCPYCSGKKVNFKDSFGYNYFDMAQSWSLSNSISPFKVMQTSGKKYKFICPKCGNEFSRRLADVGEKGCICPKCSKSKGEKRVEQYLINNNIKYKDEVKFKSLVSNLGNPLRYDFYLIDYNILIEYDGEFHFKEYFEGQKFNKNLLHDKMKNDYAKEKNIKLIRIPYWDFDNIEEILDREIRSLL
ncbi:TPA: hypothetical protein KQC30_002280 [Clostridioides difficile]|nr:hypothetical protein [Clostridioides difficile]